MTKGIRFFLKKNLFQNAKFFVRLCPVRTDFETTIRQSINYTRFVHCCQETFHMVVHTTKSRLTINSCCEFSRDTSISRNGNFPFFPVKRKKTFGWQVLK